jgi:alcohol dehydrogenase
VQGTITLVPCAAENTLEISVPADVRAIIDTFPLESTWDACGKMRPGEAKFRMVLTMEAA